MPTRPIAWVSSTASSGAARRDARRRLSPSTWRACRPPPCWPTGARCCGSGAARRKTPSATRSRWARPSSASTSRWEPPGSCAARAATGPTSRADPKRLLLDLLHEHAVVEVVAPEGDLAVVHLEDAGHGDGDLLPLHHEAVRALVHHDVARRGLAVDLERDRPAALEHRREELRHLVLAGHVADGDVVVVAIVRYERHRRRFVLAADGLDELVDNLFCVHAVAPEPLDDRSGLDGRRLYPP